MNYLSDSDIVAGLKDSSERKRNQILKGMYERYFPLIESYVKTNSGTSSEAADVFQDAIVVFYEKVRKEDLKLSSSIKTFLYVLSRNIWLNKIRHKSKLTLINEFDENIANQDLMHISILEFSERNETLLKLINTLGPNCKQVLVLYYFERLSMKNIAKTMGFLNENGAKNKKFKCLNKLKSIILNSEHLINLLK